MGQKRMTHTWISRHYRNGSGRRPVGPGTTVGPDEVIARHVTPAR